MFGCRGTRGCWLGRLGRLVLDRLGDVSTLLLGWVGVAGRCGNRGKGWVRGRTEILGRLAGDGDFLDDGPFSVVVWGRVVGFIDVIWDSGLLETFAEVFGQGLPVGVGFLAAC